MMILSLVPSLLTPKRHLPWKILGCFSLCAIGLLAQQPAAAPKPEPDVLTLVDGEKLIGQFERSTGGSVVFKSDIAGELTIPWDKVQELKTNKNYAVIGKDVKLHGKNDISNVPQGTVKVQDQKVEVSPDKSTVTKTIPVPDAAYVVDEQTFRNNILARPNFFQRWKGTATAGATLTQATQESRSFTGAVSLVRELPGVNWLDPRNRTTLDFSATYGSVSQPGFDTIKTNIIHGALERDQYVSTRFYYFGAGIWDHNFSQGLDLQQNYGGGFGWTFIKTDNESLDFKASVNYIMQQFAAVTDADGNVLEPSYSNNLIGSTFAEKYFRVLPKKMTLNQSLSVTPAWNDLSAYSAIGSINLGIPVYKQLNATVGVIDSFLNNPPAGFKKNSFQFLLGVTYVIP